jgi:hypothetical protein
VRGHAGGADDHLEATLAGCSGVLGDSLGVAVGGANLDLVLYPELFEPLGAPFENGHVRFAADEYAY